MIPYDMPLTLAQTPSGDAGPAPNPPGQTGAAPPGGGQSGGGPAQAAGPNHATAQNNPQTGTKQPAPGGGKGANPAGNQSASPTGGGEWIWLVLLLGFVLLWVFMLGGQRKEKKKRQAMLSAVKKGDRIQTVGGIIGNVQSLDDQEIVVKVDENANTRLRFARSAVQNVLDGGE